MSDKTYTREQAMKRLGLKSIHMLLQIERRYPDAFVVVKKNPFRYDKEKIDKFADRRDYFKKAEP